MLIHRLLNISKGDIGTPQTIKYARRDIKTWDILRKGVGHVRSEDSYITIFDRFGANSAQTFPSILRLVGKY